MFNPTSSSPSALKFFPHFPTYQTLPSPMPENYFPHSPVFPNNKFSVFMFRDLQTNKISYVQVYLV